MIPDVPEELQQSEGINTTALYTTNQYVGSVHSKSKSKIGSVLPAQYFSTSTGYNEPSRRERRNTIFAQHIPTPQLIISNNFIQPANAISNQPLQLVQ